MSEAMDCICGTKALSKLIAISNLYIVAMVTGAERTKQLKWFVL